MTHSLRAVPITILLLVPVVFASMWLVPVPLREPVNESPPVTQRLPVEIITTDTPPKWVLVPIDPG